MVKFPGYLLRGMKSQESCGAFIPRNAPAEKVPACPFRVTEAPENARFVRNHPRGIQFCILILVHLSPASGDDGDEPQKRMSYGAMRLLVLVSLHATAYAPNVPTKSANESSPVAERIRDSSLKRNEIRAEMRLIVGALLIAVLTFIAYIPALKAGFIWDDDDMLTDNPLVQGCVPGLRDIWFSTKFFDYYPLTLTSLWIEWKLWGMNASRYHFTNVLLHVCTAIVFWRVFLRLAIPGAFIAALAFALHPVNVESVAWIAERKNTLPMVFYGLSILWFLRSYGEEREGNGRRFYWFAIVAFVLALLSKTSVVMLPFVLLGCVWWIRGKITKADFTRVIPFFIVSLVLGLVTVWVQYHRAISTDVVQAAPFVERLARAGWAVWFYLSKAIWPFNLSFVYPRWEVNERSIVSYLPGISVLLVFAILAKLNTKWSRPVLFGFAYFVVTLFPVLGFFNIYFQKYSFVADHWQYTSIFGPIVLLMGGCAYLVRRTSAWPAIGGLIVAALGFLTWQQTKIYANDEVLWTDTIRKNPKAAIAYQNLGTIAAERGDMESAMKYFRSALAANPEHENAHYSLATCYAMQGKIEEALPHLREAIRIKPDFSMALNTLAWILATHPNPGIRDGTEAVKLATRAVELSKENNAGYLDTLAAALAESKNFNEAVKVSEKAVAVARATGHEDMIDGIQQRQAQYENRRPYRESP